MNAFHRNLVATIARWWMIFYKRSLQISTAWQWWLPDVCGRPPRSHHREMVDDLDKPSLIISTPW
jgi:hypothetical protein